MNCKQLNSIGLEEVLAFLGHLPTRQNEKEAWYLSPFGPESHASFKVDRPQNLWYLFSEGAGGTTTDFIQKYLHTSVKEALEWASNQNFSSFHPQTKTLKPNPNYRIDKIMDISHPNLIQYLYERGLSEKVYPFIKEVWFTIENKQLYAVGFKNNSDGWELRNVFYKGALLKKDITFLPFFQKAESISQNEARKNAGSGKVAVFEGFTDALSFIELQKSFEGDLLVLNSTAMLNKALTVLDSYLEISLFLDNDKAGTQCKDTITKHFPHARDFSLLYSDHKDLNEFLTAKMKHHAHDTINTAITKTAINEPTEKQNNCKEETNRIKKGLQRKM
ncbi:CHC2 zinc finger [Chryseobacterium taichungense]|uniref:CHC2 zinc finger n=1 Tax=Chryseobacterium taichungense TaxID=295069 RepID=A0A1H7VYG1_9FLAO|nr:toprim domain-containing protein [Chryseobacterium taichungense]SEM13815.1 CHC2 zinc finger [Chryseobacterium taichungense]